MSAPVEAIPTKPGWLYLIDNKGRRHLVAAASMGKPQATGPNTTYLTLRGYMNLFVSCPIGEVTEAVRRARDLRKAAVATATQMKLDFEGSGTAQTNKTEE